MIRLSLAWLPVRISSLSSLWKVASLDFAALMDVGGNVLQAASKAVSRDIGKDPAETIEVRLVMAMSEVFYGFVA